MTYDFEKARLLSPLERLQVETRSRRALRQKPIKLVKTYPPGRAVLRGIPEAVRTGEAVSFYADELLESLYERLSEDPGGIIPENQLFIVNIDNNNFALWFCHLSVWLANPKLVLDLRQCEL